MSGRRVYAKRIRSWRISPSCGATASHGTAYTRPRLSRRGGGTCTALPVIVDGCLGEKDHEEAGGGQNNIKTMGFNCVEVVRVKYPISSSGGAGLRRGWVPLVFSLFSN